MDLGVSAMLSNSLNQNKVKQTKIEMFLPRIIKVLCLLLGSLCEGYSDFQSHMTYQHIPELDGVIFNGIKTESIIKTAEECALLCLRTTHCHTFSVCDTQCFIYSAPYAFLNPSTTLSNAKTYRSIFDLSYQVCDGDFNVDSGGDLCYLFMDGDLNKKTWSDAFISCLELDSLLINLDTEEKVSQYIQLIQELGLPTIYRWTGGLDAGRQNKNWMWLTGRPVNDSQWLPFEPSHNGEQCAEIRTNQLGLNDEPCISQRNFICEKP